MKPEEAISAIKNNMPTKGTYTILTEALELAMQSLEKQVVKSCDILCNASGVCYDCPECGAKIDRYDKYCFNCGQRVDWSEIDE